MAEVVDEVTEVVMTTMVGDMAVAMEAMAVTTTLDTTIMVAMEEVVAMEAKQAGGGLRRGINHIKGRTFTSSFIHA